MDIGGKNQQEKTLKSHKARVSTETDTLQLQYFGWVILSFQPLVA